MCKLLKVPRNLVYYHLKKRKEDNKVFEEEIKLENQIIKIFRESRNNYGTRKIKKELQGKGIVVSRRKIGNIMKKYSLISNYTVAQYKVRKSKCNEDKIENVVDREFDDREKLEVVVSDLTYVRVNNKWCYVCTLLDLHNKEVIGYSAGENKDAELVYQAFLSCKYPLSEIEIFHTDNSPAESFNNILKTECIKGKKFNSLRELEIELMDYIKRVELDQYMKEELNHKLQILIEKIKENPKIKITYFEPDEKKDGGDYVTATGTFKKIDEYEKIIFMTDDIEVPIDEIIRIEGEIFKTMVLP